MSTHQRNEYFQDPEGWLHRQHQQYESSQNLYLLDPEDSSKIMCNEGINTDQSDLEQIIDSNILKVLDQTYQPFNQLNLSSVDAQDNQNPSSKQQKQQGQRQNNFKRQARGASVYSKKYREKKKEKMNKIEQQNAFLKKKINELQSRLRQKQLELNRIKFNLTQDDWTIQQLNEEMMKKLTLISDVQPDSSMMNEEKSLNEVKKEQQKISQFSTFYEEHGFGGYKKKQVLEYYMNEFLQNIMRDREKYQVLDCIKRKYLNQHRSSFDLQIDSILAQTEEEKQKRLKFFDHLRPILIDLMETCKQFYRSYQKVISRVQRIHNEMKIQFFANLGSVKKKSLGAAWFQKNQYRKQMRNVRAEWIELVKSEDMPQERGKSVRKKRVKKQGS